MQVSLWPSPTLPFHEVLALARHAEATGWDGLWYADHFMPNAEDTSAPWPEAWMTLAGVGAQVPRIRLGTLVTGNTYRHPAVLAKMAATLDHMTEGRVVLGLGSGWQENEHRQYGIPFYTVKERLQRLEEACAVIKALFSESKAGFEGRLPRSFNLRASCGVGCWDSRAARWATARSTRAASRPHARRMASVPASGEHSDRTVSCQASCNAAGSSGSGSRYAGRRGARSRTVWRFSPGRGRLGGRLIESCLWRCVSGAARALRRAFRRSRFSRFMRLQRSHMTVSAL